MSMTCSTPQFNIPFISSVSPYMDSHYITSAPAPPIDLPGPAKFSRVSPQLELPPSPSSSTGSHRVSKAKKGKRVHGCEFPGCNKIFTRAEHRRRHELSHKDKKLYACTYEGCTKAFHRSDYLSQHVARHESEASSLRTPPLRSSSVSSPTHSHPNSVRSPVTPAFQTVLPRTEPASTSSMVACCHCYNCQSRTGPCVNVQPIYFYPSTPQPPLSSAPLLPSQFATSQGPVAFETSMDQYLRSVLRPEAFLPTPQPLSSSPKQEQPGSAHWASIIDPQLPPLNAMGFQNSTPYSPWTTGADSVPAPVHSTREMTDYTSPSRNS
ncbi:Zinc finger C2H2 [Penicillium argentinense]|uniref:Zinc finger C2H2 n=1 Tax=Penicillium argentinense TaxID=1131581 RepID=A0A9W9FE36_9EURO|nr:Zinc finger C2H2 [Penicillium argentinense]KAJ5098389.1 Zinc finger C2H2 [Penicillium argentinense]